jgi:hypothetical protein
MPQTAISNDPAIGLEGQVAYPLKTFVDPNSRFVAQAAGIPFGRFVVRAGDQTVKLPATAGDITATTLPAISIRQPYDQYNATGYKDGEPICVVYTGYVWMLVDGPVVHHGPVHARITAGGNGLGSAMAAATAESVVVPGAVFDTSTTGAGLAIVRLVG